MQQVSKSFFSIALSDVRDSVLGYKIWSYLGWSDIQQRYRGSHLGPFWITLSMIITIAALSVVYSRLLHQDIYQFIPFLTVGMLAWIYFTSVINESCDVFINSKDLIENIKMPYITHILRLVNRNIIILAHNFVVYLFVIVLFRVQINFYTLLFIPGFLLVSMNLIALSMVIGLLGARFRDIPPVVSSIVTVLFFISPVTWEPKLLGEHSLILKLNPFTYYLDLVRSPLLGVAPQQSSFWVCMFLTLCTLFISAALFARYRSRIIFWL